MSKQNLDIEKYVIALELPPEGVAYALTASKGPSRNVQNRRGNRLFSYPSQKMGFVIQVESGECEFPCVMLWERNTEVLAYFPQPGELKVCAPNSKGSTSSYFYTPDFMILEKDGIQLVECKEVSDLQQLEIKCPGKYVFTEGRWHFPAAEIAARALGFEHIILTPNEIDQTLKANYLFLEDFFLESNKEPDETVKEAVREAVRNRPGLTLRELREITVANINDIHTMIAKEQVYVDLTAARLESPDEVRIFTNRTQADACQFLSHRILPSNVVPVTGVGICIGTEIKWGHRHLRVQNILGEHFYLSDKEDPHLVQIHKQDMQGMQMAGSIQIVCSQEQDREDEVLQILKSNEKHLEAANERLAILKEKANSKTPLTRNERRWQRLFEAAERDYGYGFLGLIPDWKECGNRTGHLTEATRSYLEQLWNSQFKNKKNMSATAFYRTYLDGCKEAGAQEISKKTIRRWIKINSDYLAKVAREGKGGAMDAKPFIPQMNGRAPKAEFPWQRCHVDHTLLDLQVIIDYQGTKPSTARVWFSVLYDDYSGRILAAVCLLDPPSYRTCMLLLRKCVERWHRLPQTIVVDGGKEFHSTYFNQLLSMYYVSKEQRPPREPRFGARIERFFGTNNSLWLHHLSGNTKLMKEVRKVTKAVNPSKLAVWPFDEFVKVAEEFVYEVYDQRPREIEGASPKELFEAGLSQHGSRPSREIAYNETFIFATMPSIPRETAKVQRGRGIKIWRMYYSSETLISPALVGTKVPVRYDPYNVSSVYAYANGSWVECTCHLSQQLRSISVRRLNMAARVLRAKLRHGAQRQKDYDIELGAFLRRCGDKEIERQALRDHLQAGGKVTCGTQKQTKMLPVKKTDIEVEKKILPFPVDPTNPTTEPHEAKEEFGDF